MFRGGTVPLEFTGDVNPTLDVDQYLNEWRTEFESASTAQVGLTFEDGFLYKIHGVYGNVVNGAGQQSLEVYPYIACRGNFMGLEQGRNYTAVGIFGLGISLPGIIAGTSMDMASVGINRGGLVGTPGLRVCVLYQRWAI